MVHVNIASSSSGTGYKPFQACSLLFIIYGGGVCM
jgi:hypothetical protein